MHHASIQIAHEIRDSLGTNGEESEQIAHEIRDSLGTNGGESDSCQTLDRGSACLTFFASQIVGKMCIMDSRPERSRRVVEAVFFGESHATEFIAFSSVQALEY